MIARVDCDVSAEVRSALEHLCREYWFPLYCYTRRLGRSHHEAEDSTQAFLARLLAAEGISRARRERGRFRTFLITGLRNFLTSEWQRARAEKRGGGQAPLPFEIAGADERFAREPVDGTLTPDQAFDRSWALGTIERSLREIQRDYDKSGRGVLFAALAPLVWGDGADETFAAPAARLGMTTHAFTVAVHRLRQRVGQRLRADIAETVASEAEVDDELRHLITAVGTTSLAS
jgi:RNA polymerase sigma-70 factor (ECF subfamily)